MDPKTYCSGTLASLQRADAQPLLTERAQVHVLLTHFPRFAPPDGAAFAREQIQIVDAAEREEQPQFAASRSVESELW